MKHTSETTAIKHKGFSSLVWFIKIRGNYCGTSLIFDSIDGQNLNKSVNRVIQFRPKHQAFLTQNVYG